MGKPRIINNSHEVGFYQLESYEAECLESKIQKMNENHEAISELSPAIYTEEKDGVRPEFNIRADKWDLAQNAMDKVNREKIAKGMQAEIQKNENNTTESNNTTQGDASKDARLPS